MLTLYIKDGCPYCAVVLRKVDELGVDVTHKNIKDNVVAEELIERGGKRQVPYLIDDSRDVEMYESADIAEYLDTHYKSDKESA